MLKVKILYLFVFVVSFHSSFGQGIIIDHNCTDVTQIPSAIVDSIIQNGKLQGCATSHGHQVLTGLMLLEQENSNYPAYVGNGTNNPNPSWINGGWLPNTSDNFDVMDGKMPDFTDLCGKCCVYCGPSYWDSGVEDLTKTFNCWPDINVSWWGWCTELSSYSSTDLQVYLDAIENYEMIFPNVTFVYSTGTAEGSGDEGYNRFQRNNEIRQYCIQNNKILFDFADLECWSNGEMHYYTIYGDTVPLQHPDYHGDTHHHTNALNCLNKGKAVWYMMARMQGWQPGSIRLNIRLFLEGPFNGNYMSFNLSSGDYIPLLQPYNIAPWFYNGQESVPSIPHNYIIDWVLLELRDAQDASMATPQTMIGRKAVFLLFNGFLVDLDGYSEIVFESHFENNLYAVIWHRNHLGIMSSNPLNDANDVYQYDFSLGSSQAFGDSLAQSPISPYLWGLTSGNGNDDSEISISDKTDIWQNQAGEEGYFMGDYNLDGQVNSLDKNENWIKNMGSSSQVPQ